MSRMIKKATAWFAMIVIVLTMIGCGTEETIQTAEETGADTEVVESNASESESEAAEETALFASLTEADEYYESGLSYFYGTDETEIDYAQAFSDFEKAKESGKVEANLYLGLLYGDYGYPQQDYELARKYYEACGDNPYAQIGLCMLYISGQGVEKNKEKAVELVSSVIESGVVEGYLTSGIAAADENDYVLALEYFHKVLDGTEPVFMAGAMNNLGIMYENGLGVERDYTMAMEWFEKSAALNDTTAMSNIGFLYADGLGVEQDYAKAMEWFEKSAELDNSIAMVWIGYMYEYGDGVEQDYAKAMEWFMKSADLNNYEAMTYIAELYENGLGVKQDYNEAMRWYNKADDVMKATQK